jgi:hypothetical protein
MEPPLDAMRGVFRIGLHRIQEKTILGRFIKKLEGFMNEME